VPAYEGSVAALGGIDILVLNASIQIKKPCTECTRAELNHHYAVNFRSSYELLQLATPAMIERRWGRLLTTGSVQELRPHIFAAYIKRDHRRGASGRGSFVGEHAGVAAAHLPHQDVIGAAVFGHRATRGQRQRGAFVHEERLGAVMVFLP
jgi:hypothetical protein